MRFIAISTLFISGIVLSLILDFPLYIALLFGLILFYLDAYSKDLSHRKIIRLMGEGLKTVSNLIIIFTMLGILTAGWRMSNTIPYLVYEGSKFIQPKIFYLLAFILSLLMSMLIGSVNGTVTTIGIVLINLARVSNLNLLVSTGAILSGAMFGDRASPVSSSASLVADLTGTNVVENRKIMLRSAFIPLVISCLIYLFLSILMPGGQINLEIIEMLGTEIEIKHLSLIPAVLVLLLGLGGGSTKKLLLVSILASHILAFLVFDYSILDIIKYSIIGLDGNTGSEIINKIVSGGGIVSMLSLILNVSISAMIFGILRESKFLDPVDELIDKLEKRVSRFAGITILSLVFSIVFCTQALVVMVIKELYENRIEDSKDLMLDIENSAIVIPSLIPWNLAANAAFVLFEVNYIAVVFNVFVIVLVIYHLLYRKVHGYKK